jgi:hypothetical protein
MLRNRILEGNTQYLNICTSPDITITNLSCDELIIIHVQHQQKHATEVCTVYLNVNNVKRVPLIACIILFIK